LASVPASRVIAEHWLDMPRLISSLRTRRNFALAHFSKSLAWSLVDILQAYFLHVVLGLSAFDTARVLVVCVLFGACWNIIIGALVDLRGAGPARVLWVHFIGAVLTAVTIFMQFSVRKDLGELMVTGVLFRCAYALYDVPQTALTSILPVDEQDASVYIQLRSALSALARLAVAGTTLALGELPATIFRTGLNWTLAGITLLIVLTAGTLLLATPSVRGGRTRPNPARRLALPQGAVKLLISLALSVTLLPIMSRLLIFAPAQPDFPHRGAWLVLAYTLGNVIAPFAVTRLEMRLGWRTLWLSSMALGVVSGDALAALIGDTTSVALVLSLVHGVGLGFVGVLEWEMASRLVRRHAAATGQRTDGMMFGLFIFVIQISVALASVLLGGLLDRFVKGEVGAIVMEIAAITLSGMVITPLMARDPISEGPARLDTDAAFEGGTNSGERRGHARPEAASRWRAHHEAG
jgi:glycoside/pentoside/hexuronide:cation symporter, GPH family